MFQAAANAERAVSCLYGLQPDRLAENLEKDCSA
jgi:hypothetical protein